LVYHEGNHNYNSITDALKITAEYVSGSQSKRCNRNVMNYY